MAGKGALHGLSAAEVVVAAVYIAWRLYRDGRVAIAPEELGAPERARGAYLRELRRQAALLDGVAHWYVAPLAVGWLGLQVASAMMRLPMIGGLLYLLGGVVFGVLIVLANRHSARKLRDRAAQLAMAAV